MILVGMLTFGALVAIACACQATTPGRRRGGNAGRMIRVAGDARAISRGTYGRRLARRTAYRTVRRW